VLVVDKSALAAAAAPGGPVARGGSGRGGRNRVDISRGSHDVAAEISASLFKHSDLRGGAVARGGRANLHPSRRGLSGDVASGRSPYERLKGPKPMIVLDGPNVAMRHGKGKLFSCAGIQHAIVYYQNRGHTVLVILPEAYLDSERAAMLKRASEKVQARVYLDVCCSRSSPPFSLVTAQASCVFDFYVFEDIGLVCWGG
jgi:hypothetical protein